MSKGPEETDLDLETISQREVNIFELSNGEVIFDRPSTIGTVFASSDWKEESGRPVGIARVVQKLPFGAPNSLESSFDVIREVENYNSKVQSDPNLSHKPIVRILDFEIGPHLLADHIPDVKADETGNNYPLFRAARTIGSSFGLRTFGNRVDCILVATLSMNIVTGNLIKLAFQGMNTTYVAQAVRSSDAAIWEANKTFTQRNIFSAIRSICREKWIPTDPKEVSLETRDDSSNIEG